MLELRDLLDAADAEAGAGTGRLDEPGTRMMLLEVGERDLHRRPSGPRARRCRGAHSMPAARSATIRRGLVHRGGRGEDARADVEDVEHLEHALDGAVLAVGAVQRPDDVEAPTTARRAPRTTRSTVARAVAGEGSNLVAVGGDLGGAAVDHRPVRGVVGDVDPAASG